MSGHGFRSMASALPLDCSMTLAGRSRNRFAKDWMNTTSVRSVSCALGSTDDQGVGVTAAQQRIDGQAVVLLVPGGSSRKVSE
jgi:hypothetical protein